MLMFLVLILVFLAPLIFSFICKNMSFSDASKACTGGMSELNGFLSPSSGKHGMELEWFHDAEITAKHVRNVHVVSRPGSIQALKVWLPQNPPKIHDHPESPPADIFENPEDSFDDSSMDKLKVRLYVFRDKTYMDLLHHPIIISSETPEKKVLDFGSYVRPGVSLKTNDVIILDRQYLDTSRPQFPNLVKLLVR